MATGNQHASRKADLLKALDCARKAVRMAYRIRTSGALGFTMADHYRDDARYALTLYRAKYNAAPASTRRRWACGQ